MGIFKNEGEGGGEEDPGGRSDPRVLPLLPLRDIVVFPHMVVPLFVGRTRSIQALEEAMGADRELLLCAQREAGEDEPAEDDIHQIGTIGSIIQLLRLPDGTVKVLVEGRKRARIVRFEGSDPYFSCSVEELPETEEKTVEIEALVRTIHAGFEKYVKLNKKVPPETLNTVTSVSEPGRLADTIVAHLNLKLEERQELLELAEPSRRLEEVYARMQAEIEVLEVERKIRGRVKKQMERSQKEYYLNEQMRAIQKELGDRDEFKNEVGELEDQLKAKQMPDEARSRTEKEIRKLKMMSPMSAEATVVRNYIDWILALPWDEYKEENHDIGEAERILDEDHFGLEKPKERILEYLAVQERMRKVKGPILCLVGPPGVGKTSLGQSIARATGRNFVRMSLGGVRDEAEIRGHRRTYIGSMPGKVIQGMKKAKASNPLFLLDEVDKLGADWRGDPSSALLEVLDPEQNSTFNDHYLEVDYDLSDVMFVTTANTLRMPQPLLDRMEVIRLPGYTEDEKVEIARRHLIPKQLKNHGVKEDEWSISDSALRDLIRLYTREAGVRNLERELANLIRKAVKEIALGQQGAMRMTRRNLQKFAGVARYRHSQTELEDLVGVSTGLAWTEVGGEILSIEAVTVPGKGKVSSTGKLGDVMKESIQAAEYYVKSRCVDYGIKPTVFERKDIHVHVPEGATPKDGPSAGVAMVTAIVSVLTGTAIRRDVAMTGEVTLRGRVLPIGGLKEKLLAALRSGITTVLIPKENEKDLADIPDNVKRSLEIIPTTSIDEVLEHALVEELKPIDWIESEEEVEPVPAASEKGEHGGLVTH